ncbi:ATP-binding cassette domain-containing protein [Roseomonas sp. CCTCC AB2023176]|uniref:ATP-binding cassette domain-containing protein n=1 Tax=Roseomonas sp. CCTCC AB2023176 TaxID=3342640 RepID=UPI0035E1E5DC
MIRFEGVSRRYDGLDAVLDVTFDVPAGGLCVLLGESGSGKTTLLRMVNRLVEPTAGRVLLGGTDVATRNPDALRRGIGYVIQSVGLFPHRDVAANIATVPRLLRWDAARVAARVDALLDLVGLEPGAFRHRMPGTLSGGQAQRVGLARALAADPPVLLMDEPFSALDPATRRTMQAELRRIHAATGKTILLVTHDVEEALVLADLLAVMDRGQLVAAGRPLEVLGRDAPGPVRALFGAETLAFHRLALHPAAVLARPDKSDDGPALATGASARDALMLMLAVGRDRVALDGDPSRTVRLADLLDLP